MHEIFAAIIYAIHRILHSTEKVFLLNMVNWLHHLTIFQQLDINRLISVGWFMVLSPLSTIFQLQMYMYIVGYR